MTLLSVEKKQQTPYASRPTIFDLAAYYEPSADFVLSRKTRDSFEQLADQYTRSTLLLGRFGGRPVMQTQVQGIGVATRLEVGRLALRPGGAATLLQSALEMFAECEARSLTSGKVDVVHVFFHHADSRRGERDKISAAFRAVFGDVCSFLAVDRDVLALGQCTEYQTLPEYISESGLFHSIHRNRVEKVQQHLQEEVGRYENHHFLVLPEAVAGDAPKITFCYTGAQPEKSVEIYVGEYTGEQLSFVPSDEIASEHGRYSNLEDYERASRRYGGLWVQQEDLVRFLDPQQLGTLYLFCDGEKKPEIGRLFDWGELAERQRQSSHISRAVQNSETFLHTTLIALVRKRFVIEDRGTFRLADRFADFTHVHFFNLGEARHRR